MTHSTATFLLVLFLLIPSVDARSQPQRDTLYEIVTLLRDLFHPPATYPRLNSYVFTQEELRTLPYRERDEFLRLLPGVYELNGNLHVQGGRPHDLGHYINGVRLTNRYLGTSELHIIPEAIESLSLSTGGYGAEMGFATAGIVSTRMRTGGDELRFKASVLTDNVVKTGNEFLRTTSFGYRTSVLTAEGMLPFDSGIRFFIAGENHFVRNRQARFVEPFRYDSLRTDIYDIEPGRLLPGPVAFSKNYIPNNWLERNTVQGTLLYEPHPFSIQLTGSYQHNSSTTGAEWPYALVNIFNQRRVPKTNVASGFLSLAGTYNPSEDITVNASLTYYNRSSELVDPDFGTDWQLFTDSIANAQKGNTGFNTRWSGPSPYSVVEYFRINREGTPLGSFSRDGQRTWMFNGTVSMKLTDDWRVKVGGEHERWTMRRFTISQIAQFMHSVTGETFAGNEERRAWAGFRGRVNHYGYDVDGNLTDDGFDGPRQPVFAAAFMENTYTQTNLEIHGGLRYEYFNPRFMVPPDMNNIPFNHTLNAVDESKLVEAKGVGYLLPRVLLTYSSSPRTTVFASFDKHAQMPPMFELYAGNTFMSRAISILTRGNAFNPPIGFAARPERATRYAIGIQQSISELWRLKASLFVKDLEDLLYSTRYTMPTGPAIFLNGDQATAKGVEVTVDFRDPSGFTGQLFYTLSDVRGTASNPRSHVGKVEQQVPLDFITTPLDFHQTHKAVLVLNYNAGEREDFLSGVTGGIVISYGSGHRYTRIDDDFPISLSPWDMGVIPFRDPRFTTPVEPINSSVTPSTLSVDVRIGKEFSAGPVQIELYVLALNLFNKKNIIDVYPVTGSAEDDGWLGYQYNYNAARPQFRDFYRSINLQNRWAYTSATGNDLYGSPRQIRFGMRVGL